MLESFLRPIAGGLVDQREGHFPTRLLETDLRFHRAGDNSNPEFFMRATHEFHSLAQGSTCSGIGRFQLFFDQPMTQDRRVSSECQQVYRDPMRVRISSMVFLSIAR